MQSFLLMQCLALAGVASCDHTLIWMRGRNRKEKRAPVDWFRLHAVANVMIAGVSYPDLFSLVYEPGTGYLPACSEWPPQMGLALHLYHAVVYPMRRDDWLHHVLFVFGCGPLCYVAHCRAMSLYYLFCTGLPGGLDYAALALQKHNVISRQRRRRWVALNNAYFRMPGMSICSFLVGCTFVRTGYLPLALLSFLAYLNGCYYGKRAIEAVGQT